ncbi:YiiX/YebB-like N1pC/P60 family cysteine hydrolase [Porifericola rhodea]|uniref:YiiX/YebB-like N1pC/P60 family cysteine hydrolase n=1 Tax=Porifericola rhodea TaxID=930972 RepID=UPI002665BEA4|nr:YiiX/YebB-like N1pC/P60 family cysteine hydrolase [Porifericola rhodea]WKN33267.1 YiiX/YebB-like N1pC/P60 family cysteine hydrolase [Porifericola rhodea]
MHKLFALLSLLLLFNPLTAQPAYQPQAGDILFQDLDCGPYCESIEKVTEGIDGADFSHMGILVMQEGQPYVYEAVSKGVLATPLTDFLKRNTNEAGQPKVMIGRLNTSYQKLIPEALKEAKGLLGNAYDDIYIDGDDRYYCSELIYEIFKRANKGQPLFKLAPMTYIDPDTQKTFPIWEDYFKERGVAVPEGVAGINPGLISRSPYLQIIYRYYQP